MSKKIYTVDQKLFSIEMFTSMYEIYRQDALIKIAVTKITDSQQ